MPNIKSLLSFFGSRAQTITVPARRVAFIATEDERRFSDESLPDPISPPASTFRTLSRVDEQIQFHIGPIFSEEPWKQDLVAYMLLFYQKDRGLKSSAIVFNWFCKHHLDIDCVQNHDLNHIKRFFSLEQFSPEELQKMSVQTNLHAFDEIEFLNFFLTELSKKTDDFRKINLSGMDLRGLDFLKSKDFSDAILVSCHFGGMNLSKTCFQGANLRSAQLPDCQLNQSDFSESCLLNAYLEGSNFEQAKFEQAKLQNTNCKSGNFRFAQMRKADLTRTNFEKADLTGADLEASVIEQTNFTNAILDKANFKKVQRSLCKRPTGPIFNNTSLLETNFRYANLQCGIFKNLIFRRCDCTLTSFNHSNFSNVQFERVDLDGSQFITCFLDEVSFQESRISRADFDRAIFTSQASS